VSLLLLSYHVFIPLICVTQIVVGSIVAKAPNSPLAQPALEQINAAFALFDRAARQQTEGMGRPAKALVCLFCLSLLSAPYDCLTGCSNPPSI
jgi:hypothetical protein